MTDSASRGADFLAKAEKKLKGFAIFGNKWEEGAELLEKAANCFKLAKMCACPCADVPGPWATAPHSSVVCTRRVQPHAGWSGCAAAALCARVGTVCTPVARACVAVRCAGARRCFSRVNPSLERARRGRLGSATPCDGALRLAPGCVRAGNEAGECYVKLSECHLKLDSKHEAASALVDASNAFKKTNKRGAHAARPPSEPREPHHPLLTRSGLPRSNAESANCLNKAAEYFTDLGRLSIAAKHFKARARVAPGGSCAAP